MWKPVRDFGRTVRVSVGAVAYRILKRLLRPKQGGPGTGEATPPVPTASGLKEHYPAYFAVGAAGLLSLVGEVFFGLYWLVNLNSATSKAILPLHKLLGFILPQAWFQFFDVLSKDASTITPLIGLLLSFHVLRAGWRLLFCSPMRVAQQVNGSQGKFPFPANYQITWVQLGLIGTLWSFLLLGDQLKADSPVDSVLVLVKAFDTALLSTLSGVVAAYLLGPMISEGFRRVLAQVNIPPPPPPSAIEEFRATLQALTESAMHASRALSHDRSAPSLGTGVDAALPTLQESIASTSQALSMLRGQIDSIDLEAPIARIVEEVVRKISEAHGENVRLFEGTVNDRLAAVADQLGDGLHRVSGELRKAHERLATDMVHGLTQLSQAQQAAQARQQEALLTSITALVEALRRGENRLEASSQRRLEEIAETSRQAQRDIVERARRAEEELLSQVQHQLEGMSEVLGWLGRQNMRRTWLDRLKDVLRRRSS